MDQNENEKAVAFNKKANTKKITSLKEFFTSELSYVNDLTLWETGFRKEILNMKCIPTKQRYLLNDIIFCNLSQIVNLHQENLELMQEINYQAMKASYEKRGKEISKRLMKKTEFIIPLDEDIDVTKLDYATIYMDNFPKAFAYYIDYTKTLPFAIYELERLRFNNAEFADGVVNWLRKNKVYNLGVNHFMFRPSVKAARYGILFDNLIKREVTDTIREIWIGLKGNISSAVDELDRTFKESSKYFNLYVLKKLVTYRIESHNIFALGLEQKGLNMILETQLIVKKSMVEPASYKQVYVFNKMLVICNTISNQFENIVIDTRPIFLSKCIIMRNRMPFFDQSDNIDNLYPIYVIQKELLDIKGLYFTDQYSRNAFFEKLKHAIKQAIPARQNDQFFFDEVNTVAADSKLTCILEFENNDTDENGDTFYNRHKETYDLDKTVVGQLEETVSESSSVATEDVHWETYSGLQFEYVKHEAKSKERKKSVLQKNSKSGSLLKTNLFEKFYNNKMAEKSEESSDQSGDEEQAEEEGGCCNMLKTNPLFAVDISIQKPLSGENRPFTVYATEEGVFVRVEGDEEATKIWNQGTRKVLYDERHQLLMFMVGPRLHVAHFHSTMRSIKPQELSLKIEDFFHGCTDDKTYVVLTVSGAYDFSLIYLLNIEEHEEHNQLVFQRKLYIGNKISSLCFIRNRLIIACKEFEVVDIDSLRTQSLIEDYDTYTASFTRAIRSLEAKATFKIDSETYLLCYSGVGFYIDLMGRYKHSSIYFNWEERANHFRLYRKYVVVLSDHFLQLFDLRNGRLLHCREFEDGQFVLNSRRLRVFNETGQFEIAENDDFVHVRKKRTKKAVDGVGPSIVANRNIFRQYSMLTTIPAEFRVVNHTVADHTVSDDRVLMKKSRRKKIRKPRIKPGDIHRKLSVDEGCWRLNRAVSNRRIQTEPVGSELPAIDRVVVTDETVAAPIYMKENVSTETINEIIKAYEEKYKNYSLLCLKLVG
ncbi:RGF1 [Enterospora canceri]|uniref:RGF1 n=1 Tax=Enterospora canceri TaxID=1081671 RepID=A0A1Y1S828_9MICR|nr:RGF1 [Enterospora canceri]